MMCELCEKTRDDVVVNSPVIPWSKMAVCYECWGDYCSGREVVATATKVVE